jgi:hypothetical protein
LPEELAEEAFRAVQVADQVAQEVAQEAVHPERDHRLEEAVRQH